MLGAGLFAIGALAGLGALAVLAVSGVGYRSVWTVIQTCLILGSILFATGLLGEQIAGQRAQLREIRRQLDEIAASRSNETARIAFPVRVRVTRNQSTTISANAATIVMMRISGTCTLPIEKPLVKSSPLPSANVP